MTSLSALANIASYLATNEDRPPPSEVLSNYSSPKDDRQVYTTTSSAATSSTAMPLASSSPVAKKKPLKKRSIHNTTNDHSNNSNKKARNTSIVAPTVHTSPQTSVVQGNMSIKDQYGSRLSQWLYDSDNGAPASISFPTILMGILSAPQNSECITFLSDDCNFIIINPEGLESILPQYFENTTAPTSDEFIQLLTLWGFTIAKDPQYPHVQLYTHPMFRRGDWEACLSMKLPPGTSCLPPKKKKRKKNTSPSLLGLSPPPKKARSVTPPEIVFRPAPPITTLLPYHDIAKSLPEESAAEWLAQSAMLEQMIAATKESRRRLSMTDEMSPSTATLLEMAAAKQPELFNKTSISSIPYQDGDAASISSTLSDSEVQKMTTDVVSAAIAALNQSKLSSRGSTIHEKIMRGDSSSLSAMTEDFIQRSNSRRMQSRPAGIYGARGQSSHSTLASLRSQLSDQVDAQTKIMLKRMHKRGSKQKEGVYM